MKASMTTLPQMYQPGFKRSQAEMVCQPRMKKIKSQRPAKSKMTMIDQKESKKTAGAFNTT